MGCGRGLMMVGASKMIPNGTAVGIDAWRRSDQSGNFADAVIVNAKLEGVKCSLEVVTGDAQELPFSNESFDIIFSHWVIHNIEPEAGREKALQEMARVLAFGGKIILTDITFVKLYDAIFRKFGLKVRVCKIGTWKRLIGFLSFGSFKPRTIVVTKNLI